MSSYATSTQNRRVLSIRNFIRALKKDIRIPSRAIEISVAASLQSVRSRAETTSVARDTSQISGGKDRRPTTTALMKVDFAIICSLVRPGQPRYLVKCWLLHH